MGTGSDSGWRRFGLMLVAATLQTASIADEQPRDPLPSWIAGAAKRSIVDFVRRVTTDGSPDFVPVAERVVGSTARPRFEMRPDGPALVKTLDHLFVDDKEGKPVAIHQFIGRRPIACFGNSDGDLAMLRYTTIGNPRPSLGAILHHTDADREYAYDERPPATGRLVEALVEAPRHGWTVIDMRRDWACVFADEPPAAAEPRPPAAAASSSGDRHR